MNYEMLRSHITQAVGSVDRESIVLTGDNLSIVSSP
jgi:hypothetical protein